MLAEDIDVEEKILTHLKEEFDKMPHENEDYVDAKKYIYDLRHSRFYYKISTTNKRSEKIETLIKSCLLIL